MPELPEVENVKNDLLKSIPLGVPIKSIRTSQKKLRFDFPKKIQKKLISQRLLGIKRRAKYLLFELDDYFFISHLGMTGAWSLRCLEKTHDHIEVLFQKKHQVVALTYSDTRRFGFVDLIAKKNLKVCKWFKSLGPEPFAEDFNATYLFSRSKNKNVTVKSFIMDQRIVVGIGNIYASEILYFSKVNPLRKSSDISLKEWGKIVKYTHKILNDAILSGGSTIRDFQYGRGKEGKFQNKLKVYGREKMLCLICSDTILKKIISGRSTFYCSSCQK